MTYQQLTDRERYLIRKELSIKTSIRQIALKLSRSASTISREVRRNARPGYDYYDPVKAHSYALVRRKQCRQGSNFDADQVRSVQDLLSAKWSPQQISGRLRHEGKLSISTSTIYRWIKKNKRQAHPTPQSALPQELSRQGFPRETGRQDATERTPSGGQRAY
jgi:transposase, IS30 family